MSRHRILAAGTALALLAAPRPAGADTVNDFDVPGTPYVLATHVPEPTLPPEVLPGGPSGDFLRIAHDFPPCPPEGACPINNNTASFERSDAGPACAIHAEFDFRITTAQNGRADGLGFSLLDTGVYGRAGVVGPPCPLFVAEEPTFERSLGFGFDVYESVHPPPGPACPPGPTPPPDPNANHVSIHYDGGPPLAMIDAAAIDLASGEWIHAAIDVDTVAGTVDVVLTEGGTEVTIADDLLVPGLEPYEARVHFGGRSGGLSADHDLDNVQVAFTPCPAERAGQWSDVKQWPLVAIHAHLLPTGEVMFWDRHDVLDGDPAAQEEERRAAEHDGAEERLGIIVPRLWNPTTEELRLTAEPPFDLFCSGHTFLADGRLFIAGGHVRDNVGLADATIYDPFEDAWTVLPDMSAGRWYPTATTLANGDVLVVAGNNGQGNPNLLPEVWDVDRRAWRPLGGALRQLPLYPTMFLLADGRVMAAGPQPAAAAIDTAGNGSWSPVAVSNGGVRNYGSAVTLADGRVLLVGGVNPPTASCELLDPEAPTPTWVATGSMSFARRQINATLLPDGTVLVTGGTSESGFNDASGEVLSAELYDPRSGEWSLLAAQQVRRIYHSTALLLPDGRVLSAGGGHPPGTGGDASHFDYEVFSPPYLFRGARPVLSAAPERVFYGEPFTVSTPTPAAIADVTWVRPASVTHAFDQNQRINRLDFTPVAGGLEITPPAEPARCPPGYYMLFLIDDDGVPSEARFVQVLERMIFEDDFETGDTSAWSQTVGD